jgi:hypothetical protein
MTIETKPLEPSVAFKAGVEARKHTTSLKKTMINQIMPGSKQYFDFIDGFDSVKGKK